MAKTPSYLLAQHNIKQQIKYFVKKKFLLCLFNYDFVIDCSFGLQQCILYTHHHLEIQFIQSYHYFYIGSFSWIYCNAQYIDKKFYHQRVYAWYAFSWNIFHTRRRERYIRKCKRSSTVFSIPHKMINSMIWNSHTHFTHNFMNLWDRKYIRNM